jgi:D-galactose 1-dehydrogenase
MSPTKIAIIGIGKIAQDQHLPVITKNADFRLVGVVSQRGLGAPGVPTFKTPAELYAALPDLDAVAICTPPHVRHRIAREALAAGKHVMLEKPPAATVAEMHDLTRSAATARRVIFATWHSQYNSAVDEAKRRLAGHTLLKLAIEWKEDVRRWHPGQDWIWDAGNFGVFDPGINSLSILTKIAPGAMFVKSAQLRYPENRDTPIAASLVFSSNAGAADARLTAEFDWRQEGDQSWNIDIETEEGKPLRLTHGGSKLFVDGEKWVDAPMAEYEGLYAHFADLLAKGESAMDSAPFQLVADAFLVGSRRVVEPFHW